ncbi:MAG: hypothetical protein ACK5D5_07975 [Bacteroidota bacterium]|jgi:hypothetical protein
MKILLFAIIFLPLFSCNISRSDQTEKYDESRELLPDPEGYKKDTFILDDSTKK